MIRAPRKLRRHISGLESLESRSLLAPVLAPIPDQQTVELQTLTVDVEASDSGPVAYSLGNTAPGRATIDPECGAFNLTTTAVRESFLFSVVATAADGTACESFRVWVFNVPPSIFAGINATVLVGQPFGGSGSFSSPDAGTFVASVDYGDGSGVESPAARGRHIHAGPHVHGSRLL